MIGCTGLLALFAFVSEMLPNVRTFGWGETPCRILDSKVTEMTANGRIEFVASIRYSYQYGGRNYEADRLYPTIQTHLHEKSASADVQENREGFETSCYVNPALPEQAVLRRHSPWLLLLIFVPLTLMTLGFGGFISIRYPLLVSAALARLPRLPMLDPVNCFAWVFILVGIIPFFFLTLMPTIEFMKAGDWVSTPCRITDSNLIESRGKSGRLSYHPQIRFEFEKDGQKYRGERIQLINSSKLELEECNRLLDGFPVGSDTECWVDPADPKRSVLIRKYPDVAIFGFALLIFPVVGLVVRRLCR